MSRRRKLHGYKTSEGLAVRCSSCSESVTQHLFLVADWLKLQNTERSAEIVLCIPCVAAALEEATKWKVSAAFSQWASSSFASDSRRKPTSAN